MKILLLAGEESGLIYANRLRERLAGNDIRGYGDCGFETADLAVMGFWAVLRRIFYFLRVKRTMERLIDSWVPDVVCTIDYPGMNLKLCAYAKARGIRTVHVVCPQVWAWKSGRIPKIEASVDRLCCFLPFEPALFRPGFATFVGHPLAAEYVAAAARPDPAGVRSLALLPGSRIGEIERNLPAMLDAVASLGVPAEIPAANEGAMAAITRIVAAKRTPGVTVRLHGARELLSRSTAAVVASGTATLEAALARCPTVLVYRVSPFLAWFARRVIKGVRHIGLVNVIWEKDGGAGEAPMPELLQEDFTAANVAAALKRYLDDPDARSAAVSALDAAVRPLRSAGSPTARIVSEIEKSN